MNTFEESLLGVPLRRTYTLLPGIAAACLLAWLSIWLSSVVGRTLLGFEKSPVSPVMMAILIGILLGNLLPVPAWLRPGLSFAVKKVLKLGIILIGVRLSIVEVLRMSGLGIPVVVVCILAALLVTTLLNRRLGLPERLGTLIAVGTSICGVSAIVATGPAIGAKEEEVTYAVTVITVFGIIATLVYPYLARVLFAADPVKAGLFLGTAVHDTSQVTGAALLYADVFSQPRALDIAAVIKMVRNAFMVAVIPLMALVYRRRSEKDAKKEPRGNGAALRKLLPLFVVGFLVVALLRTTGDIGINSGAKAFGLWDGTAWKTLCSFVKSWSVNLLVVALAGVGLSTRFDMIKGLGAKPLLVGFGAALLVGVVSFLAISVLAKFVAIR